MEIYFITTSYCSQIYFIITSYMKYGWLWCRILDTAILYFMQFPHLPDHQTNCQGLDIYAQRLGLISDFAAQNKEQKTPFKNILSTESICAWVLTRSCIHSRPVSPWSQRKPKVQSKQQATAMEQNSVNTMKACWNAEHGRGVNDVVLIIDTELDLQ